MSELQFGKHLLPRIELPTRALTANDWRGLIFSQVGLDPKSIGSVDEIACWAMIVAIDLERIEEIIRRIAIYGVLEVDDEGGSGDGEDLAGGHSAGDSSPQPLNA